MIARRALLASFAALGPMIAMNSAAQSPRYAALALQARCDAVNQDKTRAAARARMSKSVARIGGQIAASKGFLRSFNGHELKLVVLPEYWMTGFPLGETRDDWREKAAIGQDDEIAGAVAAIAKRFSLFLCSNHYETDPAFPDLYFQANVVYAPSGDTVLRYRRMISLYSPTPYDVWTEYLARYGQDAIFPVAETEIGVLGAIASEEILYPEIARMLALKGAEILLHPTSEVGAPGLTPKDIAKRARALENLAYVVSANSAGIAGTPVPEASTDMMSKIVDWKGAVAAEAGAGETMVANAIIDLDGLRAARRATGMSNFLARLPLAAFRDGYAREIAPPDRAQGGALIERDEAIRQQREVIDRLIRDGVIR